MDRIKNKDFYRSLYTDYSFLSKTYETGTREYGEKYSHYGWRFNPIERHYRYGYDKEGHAIYKDYPKYEFMEPFEISPSLEGQLKRNRKYTFWEKLAGEPEKHQKQLEDKLFSEKYDLEKKCSNANDLLLISHFLLDDIKKTRMIASDHLNVAEKEYSSNTFSMFWDAIENAAQSLEELAFLVWGLSVKIKSDYEWVTSELTNFPPFFFLEAIPDTSDLISKYNKLVRQGLSNYQFASIWEARRTRETIIVGFKCLENAVHGVEDTLRDGFTKLHKQLESNARNQFLATQIQTLVLQYGLKERR